MSRARPIRVSWVSGRSLALHLTMLVAVFLCGVAARWQVQRALSGNTLSWLYVFEWPAFAVVGIWLWWVLLSRPHTGVGDSLGDPDAGGHLTGSRRAAELLAVRRADLRWDTGRESARLRAYNAYLADLQAGRPARRPR